MSVLGQNKNMTFIVLVVTRELEEKGQEYSKSLTRSKRGVAARAKQSGAIWVVEAC